MVQPMTIVRVMRSLSGFGRRFTGDQHGASAIEFALLLPLMLTLYISGVEISQAISVNRKVTLVAYTVANLIAEGPNSQLPSTEVSDALGAASIVATPYSTTPMTVVVSQIYVNTSCTATIDWSQANPSTAANTVGTTITNTTLLSTLTTLAGGGAPNTPCSPTYVIWGQTAYAYTPALGYAITGTLNLSDQIFLTPRTVSCFVYSGTSDGLCPGESS
jgi:Flp pilus assembly protein TadG